MKRKNIISALAAIALTAAITYAAIPFLMSVSFFANAYDRYILHPQEPLVTGIVLGLALSLICTIAYFFYCLLKPSARPLDKLEATDTP